MNIRYVENIIDASDQIPPPEGYDFENYDIFNFAKNPNATIGNGIYKLISMQQQILFYRIQNSLFVNVSETHPWHFWVLGYGEGKFHIYNDTNKFNLVDPITETQCQFILMGKQHCGFGPITKRAWAFHCHIETHLTWAWELCLQRELRDLGRCLPRSWAV